MSSKAACDMESPDIPEPKTLPQSLDTKPDAGLSTGNKLANILRTVHRSAMVNINLKNKGSPQSWNPSDQSLSALFSATCFSNKVACAPPGDPSLTRQPVNERSLRIDSRLEVTLANVTDSFDTPRPHANLCFTPWPANTDVEKSSTANIHVQLRNPARRSSKLSTTSALVEL